MYASTHMHWNYIITNYVCMDNCMLEGDQHRIYFTNHDKDLAILFGHQLKHVSQYAGLYRLLSDRLQLKEWWLNVRSNCHPVCLDRWWSVGHIQIWRLRSLSLPTLSWYVSRVPIPTSWHKKDYNSQTGCLDNVSWHPTSISGASSPSSSKWWMFWPTLYSLR